MVKDPQVVAQYLSDWIRDYTIAAGKKRLVVGVSGGIDSAVVFRLCEMTGLEVLPVFMPLNVAQDEKLFSSIIELISSNDRFQGSPLKALNYIISSKFYINDFMVPLIRGIDPTASPQALGNFAARMRMSILYYTAEVNDALVIGTTNLPEWGVGYFTKWGDGAVDIEPIKGLLKEEVFQLGKDGFVVAVPDVILNAAPSANLWEGQTDEGEMGVKYSDLDAYCLDAENVDDFCANKIENMKIRNNHKKCETPSPDMSGIGSFRKGDK